MNVLETGTLSSSLTSGGCPEFSPSPDSYWTISRTAQTFSQVQNVSQRKTFSQTMLHSQNILKVQTNLGLIFTRFWLTGLLRGTKKITNKQWNTITDGVRHGNSIIALYLYLPLYLYPFLCLPLYPFLYLHLYLYLSFCWSAAKEKAKVSSANLTLTPPSLNVLCQVIATNNKGRLQNRKCEKLNQLIEMHTNMLYR